MSFPMPVCGRKGIPPSERSLSHSEKAPSASFRFIVAPETLAAFGSLLLWNIQGGRSDRVALGNGWLQTGNCSIARSYRAVSSVLPLVANRAAGAKLTCPPAMAAAHPAISQTASGKNPGTQPLGAKIRVTGMLGMEANVSIGIWGGHTEKLLPPWFAAVLSAARFIAMLGKSIVMSTSDMAFTIGASVLGQVIGCMSEQNQLKAVAAKGMHPSETTAISSSLEWALQVSGGISNSPENGRKFFFESRISSAKSQSCT